MALFKVLRGNESNLPSELTDGWAYFCSDTGNFYIDCIDSENILSRIHLNANCANSLRYLNGNEYVDISAQYIKEEIDILSTSLRAGGEIANAIENVLKIGNDAAEAAATAQGEIDALELRVDSLEAADTYVEITTEEVAALFA